VYSSHSIPVLLHVFFFSTQGSISISMSLHQTSFCFVCTHLTSGQKDGDELRRNADVMEILKKTRFPHAHSAHNEKSPETILDHEYVLLPAPLYTIWLVHTMEDAHIFCFFQPYNLAGGSELSDSSFLSLGEGFG
jgi:hypothetical protein